jgi:molybdate transport repressor ModE-like protein
MLGLTLRQIRYFIAVAETGSITRAAAAVNISQSAITEAIKALEGQLGARLVERRARGVVLTHEGHQFVRHARTIMSAVADAAFAVGRSSERRDGHVDIGVTHIVAGYFLADPLARFRRVFPGITHSVVEDHRRYIAHLLINGELDLGAVVLSDLEESDALEHRVLLRSRHRLWLAPNHPLLAREQIRLADLAGEPLIALAVGECRELGERLWRQAGMRPRLHLATTSVEAVRNLVATGAGLAVLPDLLYRPWSLEGDRLEARDLVDETPSLDVGIIWRRGSPLSAPAQLFRDLMFEARPAVEPALRSFESSEISDRNF